MANIAVNDVIAKQRIVNPVNAREADDGLKDWLWHRISVRWQILSTFLLITLIAGIVAAIVIVYNAQRAAEVEIASSMKLAESLVRQLVEQPQSADSPDMFLRNLALQVSSLRHVRVLVADTHGSWTSLRAAEEGAASAETDARVPRWFSGLIRTGDVRQEIKIGLNGQQIGSVILIGNAADEIAEVWQDTLDLAVVAAILNLIVFAMLYLALGRVLSPLTELATGLARLEGGNLEYRLSPPKVRELADIARRFNALADRLGAAKASNTQLTRRLVTIQDDERRYVATELHDEMGPCLFGIRANMSSLEQIAAKLSPPDEGRFRERIGTLVEITDKIQSLNHRLLTRLRPMALGHVPLSDVISGLLAEFERLNPTPNFSLSVGHLAHGYGDTIDLTVYRCVQEGVTNVVRHARAKRATIELDELPEDRQSIDASGFGKVLLLAVDDDGDGLPAGTEPGFGLSGMEERVRALGGTLTVTSRPGQGTRLCITIPLEQLKANGSRMLQRRPILSGRP
ncbi:MAG: ATP-binding protein [Phyllobacterium sp.]